MAGFFDRKQSGVVARLATTLRKISNLGMSYDDMVVKQSMAIGSTESTLASVAGADLLTQTELQYALAMQDIGPKKYVTYFDKDYIGKREMLRKFSRNGEVNFIINIIADESIVYDNKNRFCYIDTKGITSVVSDDKAEEIKSNLEEIFNHVYAAFRFNEDHQAFAFFRQFLIEGALAFEMVFDQMGKKIIGFKELDPSSLRPDIIDEGGQKKKVWVQYAGNLSQERMLYDSQIIYISYARTGVGPISYIEPLVRSFNLLRVLENSRVIWNIMNSQWRMKMVVPVGTKSPQRWVQSLSQFAAIYREDLYLDNDSGELSVQGRPNIPFYKNYIFPNKGGEQVSIDAVENGGPDLSNMDALKYFRDKMRQESNVPFSRFNQDGGSGTITFNADGAERDEIRFAKFINRLRSGFQEIIWKPVWTMFLLKYPELKDDIILKSSIGIKFNSDNLFEKAKKMEILQKEIDHITKLRDFKDQNDKAFFSVDWLVEQFLDFTETELKENKSLLEKATAESEESQSEGTEESSETVSASEEVTSEPETEEAPEETETPEESPQEGGATEEEAAE
jgi:hypothetical protein